MLMEDQEISPEFADNLYDNIFRIWANPEIERRKAVGKVLEGYKPWAVQVLMEPTIPNQVRFDEEVNGVFRAAPTAEIPGGETLGPLNFHKVAKSIVSFELSGNDSANAGHITLVRHIEGFYIAFDFHYNATRIADHVLAARQFLDGAKLSLGQGLLRVFVADLYHAVELLAKASLFKLGHATLITSKKHEYIRSQYNLHARSGITEPRFAPLLNELVALRNNARYPDCPFLLDPDASRVMMTSAEEMFKAVVAQAHPRTQQLLQQGGA